MPSLSRCDVCLAVLSCFLLAYSSGGLSGQTVVEEKRKFNRDIRCVIQTERRKWNRQTETIISGSIENLADGPLELEVDPFLHLPSRTSNEMGDKLWAPVDLLHDSPLGTDKHDVGGVGVSIEPHPIRLQFKNKELAFGLMHNICFGPRKSGPYGHPQPSSALSRPATTTCN